jgi:hypothetical protein
VPDTADWRRGLRDTFMKTSVIATFVFLLVGCAGLRQGTSLTPAQATAQAVRLANQKADTLYHCQPFQDGQPVTFTQGRWIWSETRGCGRGDIEAIVELAANGSTNNVDVQYFDNQALP